MTKWQPIETAPLEQWVLVYGGDGIEVAVKTCFDEWLMTGYCEESMKHMAYENPTHWMPLPEAPND